GRYPGGRVVGVEEMPGRVAVAVTLLQHLEPALVRIRHIVPRIIRQRLPHEGVRVIARKPGQHAVAVLEAPAFPDDLPGEPRRVKREARLKVMVHDLDDRGHARTLQPAGIGWVNLGVGEDLRVTVY